MRIGVFSDIHDHLDNLHRVVELFNQRQCELVLFAGDLVSTISIPPLRKLQCPFVGCFGDNEGNQIGVRSGMKVIGTMANPPFGYRAPDGTKFLLTHQKELLRDLHDGCDVVIYGHTHRPVVKRDDAGRLHLNPGEVGGWTYGKPSVAILETTPLEAEVVYLGCDD